jgi:hypothetical protein
MELTPMKFFQNLVVLSFVLEGIHAFIPPSPVQAQPRCFTTITCGATTSTESESARPAIDWVKQKSLDSLLRKEDALAIISEILASDSLIDDSEELVSQNWNKIETRLRDETRPVSEILGKETTNRILKSVESLEGYDPEAVKAFLSSTAINNLFSRVLYDGIFEFFQKIDVFGNIINGLPIIGPIRKQIVVETKKQLDRSLGPLVQNFLGAYTTIAIKQASDYVLSPANQKAFGGANVKLISSLLDRPINSLLPASEMSEKLKTDSFEYLRSVQVDDLEGYVDFVYDFAGDKSLDRVVDVDKLLEASPTLQRTIDNIWSRSSRASRDNKRENE